MEAVFNMMREITLNNLAIGATCWVDITHINNPHSFYARPRAYSLYLPYIQSPGKRPKATDVKAGDVVIYRSPKVKNDIRGKVLLKYDDPETMFKLFALDYGCVETVPLSDMWKPKHAADTLPSMVVHCQLADCAPRHNDWDRQAIDAMKSYVDGERAKLLVRNKTLDSYIVELYNSCPDDIATLLAITGHTSIGYAQDTPSGPIGPPSPVTDVVYPFRELKANSILHVRMLNGSIHDTFHVVETDQFKAYLEDRKKLCPPECPKMSYPDDLKLDTAIGVYYESTDNYERGILKEIISQKQLRIYLVDWGIEIMQHAAKTIHVPEWYQNIPCRALLCCLYYKQSLSFNLNKYTHADVEFHMRIKQPGGAKNPHVVTIVPLGSQLEPCSSLT